MLSQVFSYHFKKHWSGKKNNPTSHQLLGTSLCFSFFYAPRPTLPLYHSKVLTWMMAAGLNVSMKNGYLSLMCSPDVKPATCTGCTGAFTQWQLGWAQPLSPQPWNGPAARKMDGFLWNSYTENSKPVWLLQLGTLLFVCNILFLHFFQYIKNTCGTVSQYLSSSCLDT